MKFRMLFLALCHALMGATACNDATQFAGGPTPTGCPPPSEEAGRSGAADRSSPLADLRARAEASFAEIERRDGTSRMQSRIGPQPWPTDLPSDWPRPERAVVLADAQRGDEARLLLIDLPEPPERALGHYRDALNESGFATQQPLSRKNLHALHAQRGDWQAVLSFIDRDQATRLEILFLTRDRPKPLDPKRISGATSRQTRGEGRDSFPCRFAPVSPHDFAAAALP